MTRNDSETFIEIAPGDDGQRLDRWLKKRIPYALVQKLIRKGAIRIDGKKAKADTRLAQGQSVRIPAITDEKPHGRQPLQLTEKDRAYIQSLVLYDDGDIVAIDKPHGLAAQGGSGIKVHVDGLLAALEKNELIPKLIHRLDRDTSGVLLAARKPETVRTLGKMFRSRDVRKIYWAVTAPAPEQEDGAVKAPIGKGPARDKMTIDEDEGKWAMTDFVVLDKAGKELALIAFSPRTGRTHQIRVHAAEALNAPILGDGRYGGEREITGLGTPKRLHLHACALRFRHPHKKKNLEIVAPLPGDLKATWDTFEFPTDTSLDPFHETDLS